MIKFILRTSDFADFLKNSFRGPRISRTFVKFIPRTSDFADFYQIHSADFFSGPRGPRSPRNSPGRIISWVLRRSEFSHCFSNDVTVTSQVRFWKISFCILKGLTVVL